MTEPETLMWIKWLENKRANQKKEKSQRQIVEERIQAQTQDQPSTAQRVMHAIRNPERKKRLGGGFY